MEASLHYIIQFSKVIIFMRSRLTIWGYYRPPRRIYTDFPEVFPTKNFMFAGLEVRRNWGARSAGPAYNQRHLVVTFSSCITSALCTPPPALIITTRTGGTTWQAWQGKHLQFGFWSEIQSRQINKDRVKVESGLRDCGTPSMFLRTSPPVPTRWTR